MSLTASTSIIVDLISLFGFLPKLLTFQIAKLLTTLFYTFLDHTQFYITLTMVISQKTQNYVHNKRICANVSLHISYIYKMNNKWWALSTDFTRTIQNGRLALIVRLSFWCFAAVTIIRTMNSVCALYSLHIKWATKSSQITLRFDCEMCLWRLRVGSNLSVWLLWTQIHSGKFKFSENLVKFPLIHYRYIIFLPLKHIFESNPINKI